MFEDIKISFIIPVYNVAPFLEQCLHSVFNQTMREIEIICIDDGSTDDSLDMLYSFAKKEPRMVVLENKEEGSGASQARNMGLDYARGEYLLILDSDDYFHPELAEKTYIKAKETNAQIVMYEAFHFDNVTGNLLSPFVPPHSKYLPNKSVFSMDDLSRVEAVGYVTEAAWQQLYERKFIQNHGLKFQIVSITDDIFFVFAANILAERITSLPERLVYYRRNNKNSQVWNVTASIMSPIICGEYLKQWLQSKGLFVKYKDAAIKRIELLARPFLFAYGFKFDVEPLYRKLYDFLSDWDEPSSTEEDIHSVAVSDWKHTFGRFQTVEEFFCLEYIKYSQLPIYQTEFLRFQFPQYLVSPKDKVILYGAGEVGRSYFSQNLVCGFCDIVLWVDKNYQEIGYPVKGMDCLENIEYDVILLALGNPDIVEIVRCDLEKKGLDKNCIKWL